MEYRHERPSQLSAYSTSRSAAASGRLYITYDVNTEIERAGGGSGDSKAMSELRTESAVLGIRMLLDAAQCRSLKERLCDIMDKDKDSRDFISWQQISK